MTLKNTTPLRAGCKCEAPPLTLGHATFSFIFFGGVILSQPSILIVFLFRLYGNHPPPPSPPPYSGHPDKGKKKQQQARRRPFFEKNTPEARQKIRPRRASLASRTRPSAGTPILGSDWRTRTEPRGAAGLIRFRLGTFFFF